MYKYQITERRTTIADPIMFVYKAAHDLRAPLMSVKALVYIMRNDTEKQNLDHYFSLIEQSVDKMNQSISHIIDSSINSCLKPATDPVDLTRIAQEAIQSVQFMADQHAVTIDLLAQPAKGFYSEEQSLRSILNNLLSNAIRYSDINKLSYVSLQIISESQGVKIIFKDNGIGIEDELLDKIFARFFRVNHEGEGSGLGLFIVKGAVENLGGTIQVQSVIGQGTTFTIRIPNAIDPGDQ